jgi:hypothetical protein
MSIKENEDKTNFNKLVDTICDGSLKKNSSFYPKRRLSKQTTHNLKHNKTQSLQEQEEYVSMTPLMLEKNPVNVADQV